MRTVLSVFLAAAVSGCGVELLTTTAIQGELQAEQMSAMKRQIQGAAATSGRINLRKAIDTYNAQYGTYPPSLDTLTPDFIQSIPLKPDGTPYGYDPATGRLLDGAPAGMGAAANDQQKLQDIRNAINQYGAAIGYYPPTLDALVPAYLSEPPRSASGQPFLYNNQNGYLAIPGQPYPAPQRPAQQAPRQGYGGYAGGPMGEVMTGIAIQNQLNSNSNAGTNAAGGYARRSTRGTNAQRTQTQMQVMDDLGL